MAGKAASSGAQAVACVLLLLCVGNNGLTNAGEVHLSNKGDDSNPGSFTKPVATLAAAYDLARPGDTLVLRSGNFEVDKWVIEKDLRVYSSSVLGWKRTNVQCRESLDHSWGIKVTNNATVTFEKLTMRSCGESIITVEGAARVRILATALRGGYGQDGSAVRALGQARVTIEDSFADNCVALGGGGVISLQDTASLKMVRSNFSDNGQRIRPSDDTRVDTQYGGAIYARDHASVHLVDSALYNNSAELFGGAVFLRDAASLIMERSTCAGNGNMTRDGGCLFAQHAAKVTFDRVHVRDNRAYGDGGGLFVGGRVQVKSTSLALFNNTAGGRGGGFLALESATLRADGSNWTMNSASDAGGAFYAAGKATISLVAPLLHRNSAFWGGAFCASEQARVELNRARFSENRVVDAGSAWLATEGVTLEVRDSVCARPKRAVSDPGMKGQEEEEEVTDLVWSSDVGGRLQAVKQTLGDAISKPVVGQCAWPDQP